MVQPLYPSIAQSPSATLRPAAQELDRYLATHTVAQAAQRWNVHERTVRKWRVRDDAPRPYEQPEDEPNTPDPIDHTPTFAPRTDDVAGCGTMWLDPWTKELMPIIPGTHRHTWERDRIAARDRHIAEVNAPQNIPIPPSIMSTALGPCMDTDDVAPDVAITFKALQSIESEVAPAPDVIPEAVPAPAPAPMVHESITVPIRTVINHHVRPSRRETVYTFVYDYAPIAQLITCLLIVTLLIAFMHQ